MKLLFLDIDGVLNSTRYWYDERRHLPMGKAGALDPEAVERLNAIVDRTGCAVILSSSWRGHGADDQLRRVEGMLQERGYRHELAGATPFCFGQDRRVEIDAVLMELPFERFVVLDDDLDAWSGHAPHAAAGRFVNTNYLVGLQDDGVALAVVWLNR